jgi:Cys-tRNA(Pro) deacylase
MEKPPVSIALEKINIPHTVFQHTQPVHSFEEAAEARQQRAGQIIRSILFRVGEDDYVMALVAGPAQVSWKLLRKYLGQSRLTMATEEEVLSVTGYRVGTVGPFGLPRPLRVLVESGVMNEDEVSIGSGMRDHAVILKTADLIRALKDPEVVSLLEA